MENAAGVAWQETKNAAGVACHELRARPEECAAQFREQGLLRVNGVVGRATCERLREEVDAALLDARSVQGDAAPVECRWDVFLPLDESVLGALSETIAPLRPLLDQLFTPDATLCELSALVTDAGSPRQGLHFDTPIEPGAPLLVTCFVALQDVAEDMGGTIMLPRTATCAAHQQLAHVCEESMDDMLGPTATVGSLHALPIVRCAIKAGDVVCMDSRLLHCGGANKSAGQRRRLFYFTIHDGGGKPLPRGASYSMFPQYQSKLRLNQMDWWADFIDDSVRAADSLASTPPRQEIF